MGDAEVQQIIRAAEETLHNAKVGVEDVSGRPDRNAAGVRNVATYGRAATRVLQQLRSKVDGFDAWWSTYRNEMEEDQLMNYFWDLRNEVLKDGSGVGWELQVHELEVPADLPREPEHATSFFIGDRNGGIGWEVELPDGSTRKHYINLPDSLVESRPLLPDPPKEHLGEDITDATAEEICEMYVSYIEGCIEEAREAFLDDEEE